MKVTVYIGTEAEAWLSSPANLAQWAELAGTGFASTPFIEPGFVRTWYRHYGGQWSPLLLLAEDASGRLNGFAPLAMRGDLITGVGAQQAEYQGWLCSPEQALDFFESSIATLAARFSHARLRLHYLLGPWLAVVEKAAAGDKRLMLRRAQRPLLRLDEAELAASLKKKSTRSKHNRLKRLGELTFKRIEDSAEFNARLAEVAKLYDFRQAAANDAAPFLEDPLKRPFHEDWFNSSPRDFFVTEMRVDDRCIAALVGIRAAAEAYNAMIAYAPDLSRHSPGKLHIYQTGLAMLESGMTTLDLTPGGDPWKERFANTHEEVGELDVYFNSVDRLRVRWRERLEGVAKGWLEKVSLSPAQLRTALAKTRALTPRRLWARISAWMPRDIEYRVYRVALPYTPSVELLGYSTASGPDLASVNALDDLVRFEPGESWQTRQSVLAEAMARLERGERSYSRVENGRLLHLGWLLPRQEEAWFSEVSYGYRYPEPGAVLYDFYTDPAGRGRGLYQATISQMLADLSAEGEQTVAYISVLADNGPSRHVIEKLGFSHVESIVEHRMLRGSHHEIVGPDIR